MSDEHRIVRGEKRRLNVRADITNNLIQIQIQHENQQVLYEHNVAVEDARAIAMKILEAVEYLENNRDG